MDFVTDSQPGQESAQDTRDMSGLPEQGLPTTIKMHYTLMLRDWLRVKMLNSDKSLLGHVATVQLPCLGSHGSVLTPRVPIQPFTWGCPSLGLQHVGQREYQQYVYGSLQDMLHISASCSILNSCTATASFMHQAALDQGRISTSAVAPKDTEH